MKNPFKIEKGVELQEKFDATLLSFLVESMKKLKIRSDECVYVPQEILAREKTFKYVNKANTLLRHQLGPIKFSLKTVKNRKKEVLGVRIFRIS